MQEQYIFLSLSVWHLNLITEGVEGYWCIWSHSVTHTHTHTHTSHSVGLPWTSDRPDAEPSTWQHTPLTTDRHSILTFWSRNYFLNFSTPCIQNVNNTGTKYVRIMKQTAFWRGKNGEYIQCLKYSVPIFVELMYKMQLWRLAVSVRQL